jgi:hypothetical protein
VETGTYDASAPATPAKPPNSKSLILISLLSLYPKDKLII